VIFKTFAKVWAERLGKMMTFMAKWSNAYPGQSGHLHLSLRNAEGQIIDGNPNEVQKVIDLWTFRRDTKSSDPNWLLIKTESEG